MTARARLRAWLARHPPSAALRRGWASCDADEYWAARLAWHRALHRGGWIGVSWPRRDGGGGAPPSAALAVAEELGSRGLPWSVNRAALDVAGPVLRRYGSAAQKRRFLPRMLGAEELWCLCITEAESGSDFTAARTTARPRRGGFTLDGRKRWSTAAHRADFGLVLARTDESARAPWLGLSWLIVDMKAPGVKVRPLAQATGQSEFNEVEFDGVFVPRSRLVGALNAGWRVSASLMGRESLFGCDPSPHLAALAGLLALARAGRTAPDPDDLARLSGELIALRGLFADALRRPPEDEPFGGRASVVKLAASRLAHGLSRATLDARGADASPADVLRYQLDCAGLIARGTTEIHRELLLRGALASEPVKAEPASAPLDPRLLGPLADAVAPLEEAGRARAAGHGPSAVFLGARPLTGVRGAESLLADIRAGRVEAALAVPGDEVPAPAPHAVVARPAPGGFRLSGAADHVLAPDADWLLVPARLGRGDALFLVPGRAPGVTRLARPRPDLSRRWGRVALAGVRVAASAALARGRAAAIVLRARREALVALSAEMNGGTARVLELSLAHVRRRRVAGRLLSTHQAVSHRLADLHVRLELSRSLTSQAARARGGAAALLPSLAKAAAAEAYLDACETGLHVHGAAGFTWEHELNAHHRRALSLRAYLGAPTALRRAASAALVAAGPAGLSRILSDSEETT